MPLPAHLDEKLQELGEDIRALRRCMLALGAEAEVDGVPEVFKVTLGRKANQLGHVSEHLQALPDRVAEQEAELEERAAELRRRREHRQ